VKLQSFGSRSLDAIQLKKKKNIGATQSMNESTTYISRTK
jgi:hypothetical protein